MKLLIEKTEDCFLVQEGYEKNGHDCWGNLEYSNYRYVWIDGKKKTVWAGWFIIHDGKEVYETCSDKSDLDFWKDQAYKKIANKKQFKLNIE